MAFIEKIDPNFKLSAEIPEDRVYYDPRNTPFRIYGLAPNQKGQYCRLPLEMLPDCSEGVRVLSSHLAGACIRFSTDADSLSVVWKLTEKGNMSHFPASGQSGLEVVEETGGKIRPVKTLIPLMDNGCGCLLEQSRNVVLSGGGMRSYALYLPLYNGLEQLLIGLPAQAKLSEGREPALRDYMMFYGSSITQGGCASKACNAYTHVLARRFDAALYNLGFSGNGKGEVNIAQYIASLPMSVFVMDYDHNAPTVEHLEATHYPFYEVIRQAQPDLPIVMVSKPDFDGNPLKNTMRREVIRKSYQKALDAGDKHVYFVDGELLFGRSEREDCTMDGCHPNDLGFRRMADVLEPVIRRAISER